MRRRADGLSAAAIGRLSGPVPMIRIHTRPPLQDPYGTASRTMAESVQIRFVDTTDAGAKARRQNVTPDGRMTVLDVARTARVEITATCGARGRCRSCRVKILKGDVPPPTVQDSIQLGTDEVQERFRLSCQTRIIADCTILPVPPITEGGHQILDSSESLGTDRLRLDCGVEKHLVHASPPVEEHHQTSDFEEILQGLEGETSAHVSADVLRKVPAALRERGGELTVTTFDGRIIDVEAGDSRPHVYGMAFDIGTTSVVGSLMDLSSGEQLAATGSVNPQAVYGGDLMSRIAYAQFDHKRLTTLRAKVLQAINGFVKDACNEAGVSPAHVYKIVIVGNTCMHHVFLGIDTSYVGLAPYAPVVRQSLVLPARDIPLKSAPHAQVCFLPIVAGFVGADTMACMLATRVHESEEIRAFVDIGTNGEVVMGNRDRLMACSAPAGPALEGAQIRHGMRGALGAIEKVRVTEGVEYRVIGNVPPIGICGSGLIDACAGMLDSDVLEPSGVLRFDERDSLPASLMARMTKIENKEQFILAHAEETGKGEEIAVTQSDIRQLQLAKGAIFSGIVMLMHVMKLSGRDLAELMLCGGFGNYINIENAKRIRLLPDLPSEKITYVGNAALIGGQMALLSETERRRAATLARRVEHVALATHPQFQEIFVDAISFEPLDSTLGFSLSDGQGEQSGSATSGERTRSRPVSTGAGARTTPDAGERKGAATAGAARARRRRRRGFRALGSA